MAELTDAQKKFLEDNKPEESQEEQEESKPDTSEDEPSQDPQPEPKQEEESKDEPTGTPYSGKFKQFQTVEKLEESYSASFREAQRLNEEIKLRDAEIERLKSEQDVDDDDEEEKENETDDEKEARLRRLEEKEKAREEKEKARAEAQRKQDWNEFQDFLDTHESLKDNEELQEQLNDELAVVVKRAHRKDEELTMTEALTRAWQRMFPDEVSEEDPELEGAKKMAIKQEAGTSAGTGNTPRDNRKRPQLTENEKKTARTYGMTDDEYIEFKNSQ